MRHLLPLNVLTEIRKWANSSSVDMSSEEQAQPLLYRQKCLNLRGRTADDVRVTVRVFLDITWMQHGTWSSRSVAPTKPCRQLSMHFMLSPACTTLTASRIVSTPRLRSCSRITHGSIPVTTSSLSEYPRSLSTRARLTKSLIEFLRSSTSPFPSTTPSISLGNPAHPTPVELIFREALAAHTKVGAELGPQPCESLPQEAAAHG
jgi:hypothetical protein